MDQFDVDTKKVTCYVKLERVKQDLLRKFYYFDNAIWVLNKIDSYDVTSYGTTKCEFIKVQDMHNYTAGVKDYTSKFELNGTLNPSTGKSTLVLDSTFNWEVYNSNITVTPTSGGPGITDMTVTYPLNTTSSNKLYWIEFTTSENSLHRIFTFSLSPSTNN